MQDRRKPSHEITPEYEDRGVFKSKPVEIVVELVPKFGRNSRLDIMIKGFVRSEIPIDVVFPGRRKMQAAPLVNRLHALWARANRQGGKNNRPPEIDDVRLPVRIEGSWRPRFARDDQGWQTRTHQLFASRWLIADDKGQIMSFGEYPSLNVLPRQPAPLKASVLKKGFTPGS